MKKDQKSKKWLAAKVTGLFLVVAGIATGIGFGIASQWNSGYESGNEFQNSYSIQVEVEREVGTDTSITEISETVQYKLDFAGYDQAAVNIIDDNNLYITFNMESINVEDMFSFSGISQTYQELLTVYVSAFGKYNVEFRSAAGEQMFQVVDNTVQFVQPASTAPETDTDGDGIPDSEETEPASYTSEQYDDLYPSVETYDIQLIENNSAQVVYTNGYPMVQITPNDNLWVEFNEMNSYLLSQKAEDNPTGNMYAVWFGYDTLAYVVNKVDPDGLATAGGETQLLTYCYTDANGVSTTVEKDICDPFLVGIGYVNQELTQWEQTYTMDLGLTKQEAEQAVLMLNSSTQDYSFNIVQLSFNSAQISEGSLILAVVVLMIMILLVIFTMTWYFGLLGMIGSLSVGLTATWTMMLLIAFSVPITFAVLFGLGILTVALSIITVITLNRVKDSIYKKESLFSSYKKGLGNSFFDTLPFIIGILVVYIVLGLFVPTTLQISFYFIALMTFIGAYFAIAFISTMAYTTFAMFKVGNLEETFKNKWNFFVGYNKTTEFANQSKQAFGKGIAKTSSTKSAKSIFLVGSIFITIAFSIFGILFATTGSGMNLTGNYDGYYRYDIVQVDQVDTKDPQFNNADPTDPYGQEELVKEVQQDEDEIIAIVNDYVNVKSSSLTRSDESYFTYLIDPEAPDTAVPENQYKFSYGITVISTDSITLAEFNEMNAKLANVGSGYEIEQTYSSTDILTVGYSEQITNITQPNTAYKTLIGIIFAILAVVAFAIFMFRWSGALALLVSISFELLLLVGLLTVLYIPTSPFLMAGLLIVLTSSILTKFLINRKSVKQFKQLTDKKLTNKDITKIVHDSTSSYVWQTMLIMLGMLIMSSVLLSTFGSALLIVSVSVFIGMMLMLAVNISIYPWLLAKLEQKRIEIKTKTLDADINKAKQVDSIEEEYIEGINF